MVRSWLIPLKNCYYLNTLKRLTQVRGAPVVSNQLVALCQTKQGLICELLSSFFPFGLLLPTFMFACLSLIININTTRKNNPEQSYCYLLPSEYLRDYYLRLFTILGGSAASLKVIGAKK